MRLHPGTRSLKQNPDREGGGVSCILFDDDQIGQ